MLYKNWRTIYAGAALISMFVLAHEPNSDVHYLIRATCAVILGSFMLKTFVGAMRSEQQGS